MLNLNEIELNYQVALDENWQGIAGETATRLLEQIPALVTELMQAREEIAELLEHNRELIEALDEEKDEVAQAMDMTVIAWIEVKRLRAEREAQMEAQANDRT